MKTNRNAKVVSISSAHLTEAQFGELLDGSADKTERALTPAEEHVLACGQCAAELASLREALALFRGAATAYAEEQLRDARPMRVPVRLPAAPALRPIYFAAAAALFLAAFLPMQMLHERSRQAAKQTATANATTSFERYATESDEALLEDVDHAASASVPDAMQTLADPMGGSNLPAQKRNPRKD